MSATSLQKKGSKTSHPSKTSLKRTSQTTSRSGSYTEEAEDGARVTEEQVVAEQPQERTTFFNRKYIKPTLTQYRQEQLKEEPLFADVLTLDADGGDIFSDQQSVDKTDILVTGFGIRNLKSLQDALRQDEKRLRELYKYKDSAVEAGSTRSTTSSKRSEQKSTETETERSSVKSDVSAQKAQLQYLLGIEAEAEEEYIEVEKPVKEEEEEFTYSISKSMRAAQKYLRVHRIFDFFQFIIAHLLGATPENPIDFILVLLNKCLLYRSGLGKPPLLYETKHIEQLYELMDRMNTGFIEQDQYEKGMTTLGIGEFNKNPPLSQDKMVAKRFFIEEALDSATALFDDMIKRKWIGKKPPTEPTKSIDIDTFSQSLSGPYFIPSDLLIKPKIREVMHLEKIIEGEEAENFSK